MASLCEQGQSETFGCPMQAINLVPLKTDILLIFST